MAKVDYRLIFGILVPILLSFFTVYFFNMEDLMVIIVSNYAQNDLFKALSYVLTANFSLDPSSVFTGLDTPFGFFIPHIVVWLFLGYICGTITKGFKRSILATAIIVIIDLLLWILISVIAGVDLMSMFTGIQLSQTLLAIVIAFIGALTGGILGGMISGPYED